MFDILDRSGMDVSAYFDNPIPFLFKVGRGAFHTTFVYAPATDTWQWLMDDESSGKLEPFARVTLTKR